MRKKANAERKLSPPATHSYLEEQRTLVLSLRTGRPEPVGQRAGLGGGHKVAQGQGLLLQLLSGVVPGQQAVPLGLQRVQETNNIMNHGYTSLAKPDQTTASRMDTLTNS